MEQRSDAWFSARLGRVTASRVADVVAKTKTGWSASRTTYMGELIAERLTGTATEHYTNSAMQWGIDTEADARAAYQYERMIRVEDASFVLHPVIQMAGASPDGYVGEDGLVETKCPNTGTHIDTLLGQSVPGKYLIQMQFQMACTGRQWCDFVSFDPRMPEDMRLFIKRVQRDDSHIVELENKVAEFLCELEAKLARLKSKYQQAKEEAA